MNKKFIITPDLINRSKHLTGYYNDNYIFRQNNSYYVLRIPKFNAPIFDLKLYNEVDILNSVKNIKFSIPKVIRSEKKYFIENFIEGKQLNLIYGDLGLIDEWILDQLIFFFHQLHCLKIQPFPNTPWKNSSKDFFSFIVNYIKNMSYNFWHENEPLYLSFGITKSDINYILETSFIRGEREIVLCHCDIHRKNLLIHDNNVSVIDWELSLFADPIYDLAIFLHKIRLHPSQENKFIEKYHNINKYNLTLEQFLLEIDAYRALEEIKSVLGDAKRILQDIKEKKNDETINAAIKRFEFKLKKFIQRTKSNLVPVVKFDELKFNFNKYKTRD